MGAAECGIDAAGGVRLEVKWWLRPRANELAELFGVRRGLGALPAICSPSSLHPLPPENE
jgi:hypothetical protein